MKPATKRQHYVTFYSPGTFFAESDDRVIGEWSPRTAAHMAKKITQRYGATPYGFRFSTCIVSEPVDDGEAFDHSMSVNKERG